MAGDCRGLQGTTDVFVRERIEFGTGPTAGHLAGGIHKGDSGRREIGRAAPSGCDSQVGFSPVSGKGSLKTQGKKLFSAGAGDENRTHASSLGSSRSAIELHPQNNLPHKATARTLINQAYSDHLSIPEYFRGNDRKLLQGGGNGGSLSAERAGIA
jgi:hypothetical protein